MIGAGGRNRSPFRGRTARLLYDLHHGPNMTPMVDVVMVILIFFMASTTLLGPEVLLRAAVDVPDRGADLSPETTTASGEDAVFRIEPAAFFLTLTDRDGVVVANGIGLSAARLSEVGAAAAALATRLGDTAEARLVIQPDENVPYEAVVRVTEAFRAAGFDQVAVR